MILAIFDLDNTLIGGDSDTLWGQFLIEEGIVPKDDYERRHEQYYREYLNGVLDIFAFLGFQLEILARHDAETLRAWRGKYIERKIKPIMLPKARALLQTHRAKGDTLLIVTATNRFLTEPIAALLDVEHLIATEPEIIDGHYSGRVCGTPAFAAGKVARLSDWLVKQGSSYPETWFYSDSHNDLPLLHAVTHPVAVDPDATLAQAASINRWPVISLR